MPASSLTPYITLARPHQHVKNLLVFAPVFFAGQLGNANMVLRTCIAFAAFSLVASAIYVMNDLRDIEHDRLHPKKKHRPLAAGTVDAGAAIPLMLFLMAAGLGLMAMLSRASLYATVVYIILNIGYSFILKHIVILDVVTVALGFVLRLVAGAGAALLPLSLWIILIVFTFALFIALAKRRDDVVLYLKSGIKMRSVIDGYNIRLLDVLIVLSGLFTIAFYLLYTLSAEVEGRFHNDNLYITTIFVILGVFRYFRLTFVKHKSGHPTIVMLKDKIIQMLLLGWIVSFLLLLY